MRRNAARAAALALLTTLSPITPAASPLPAFLDALSLPRLLDILTQAGLETQARTLSDGRQAVPVRIEGRVAVLLLYGCESPTCPAIDSVQAVAWVESGVRTPDGAARDRLLAHLNRFNARFPYARAYLQADGKAVLEMDLHTGNGLTPGRLGAFLGGLAGLHAAFEEHLADFPPAPTTPPPPLTPPQPIVRPATPAAPAIPAQPATPATPPQPATPAIPAQIDNRPLRVQVTRLEDRDGDCRIHSRIENRGDTRYNYLSAGLRVFITGQIPGQIPGQGGRVQSIGFNAGKGLVPGKPDAPLGPGDASPSVATVKDTACNDIDHLEFQGITFCGDAPPFEADCTDAALIVGDGPVLIIDNPARVYGDPIPVIHLR